MTYYILQALVAAGIVVSIAMLILATYKVGDWIDPNEQEAPIKIIVGLLSIILTAIGIAVLGAGLYALWYSAGEILHYLMPVEKPL